MASPAERLIGRFAQRYPGSGSPRLWRAPGRVNLIGEHTDYNEGFVLPAAIEKACFTAAAPGGDGLLRVFSEQTGEQRQWPAGAIADARPAGDWSDYVVGVARELARAGFAVAPANLLIHSTVPLGGGLSSSASLEVSAALALLGGRELDSLALAGLCQRAETGFVGLPCGIMDQYVSLFGREDSAVLLDCRSLRHEHVRLPRDASILAINTMVKHALGESAYARRVAECREAVETIRRADSRVSSLRDAGEEHLKLLSGPVLRRARHVISENARVESFLLASRRSDLEAMGRLLVASHQSLRDDYEVSCEELDFLVEAALAMPGVYGSRMTGGGFGGCTVNLVAPASASEFAARLAEGYRSRFGIVPEVYPCRPSPGAGEVVGISGDSGLC